MAGVECPDCSVRMESVTFVMGGGGNPKVKLDERRDDLLGRFGMKERLDVEAFRCPECGLVRFYATGSNERPDAGREGTAPDEADDRWGTGEWGTDDPDDGGWG